MNNNALAFIALGNEYCQAVENAREVERHDFVLTITRLLPRIYIAASDLSAESLLTEEMYINPVLEEDYYESVRLGLEQLFGPEDTYLEVFEDDMKYSDTPIAASIAEGLTDIFQSLYNLLENIKDATDDMAQALLVAAKEDFESYWSRVLCNVMRPLNAIRFSPDAEE